MVVFGYKNMHTSNCRTKLNQDPFGLSGFT